MYNLTIHFSYPWLLLLLIPALALTLIPYFRLNKRYRKTRNRICSMILHMLVTLFAVSVLCGVEFLYKKPNDKNEIILLVDVSTTEEQSKSKRDEFVETVINDSKGFNYKVGVVTFGFDQKYAVPLTYNINGIYDQYESAELPDVSATDIAAALVYTRDLFDNPETGKIVLITDGKETDEEAENVIRSIAAKGIKVDTAYISSTYEGDDVQISNVTLPDYHVIPDEPCTIGVTIQSSSATSATIDLYDNGESDPIKDRQTVDLITGTQTFVFTHTFLGNGLHKINFDVSVSGDALEQNNQYCSYLYLDLFNKVLVLETQDGDSENIRSLLTAQLEAQGKTAYELEILNIKTSDDVPTTVDQLREYDQIILNNVANKDLPDGFDLLLDSYVKDYGGGLFTVGGEDRTGDANAYNREDMIGTLYQEILPVQAINYTPPVGVMVVLDRSGSMGSTGTGGITRLDWAKEGAVSCLNSLTERDYFGLMTFDTNLEVILELTPRPQEKKITSAIRGLGSSTGGTVLPSALNKAREMLLALKDVSKRHVIIVTDGEIPENQDEDCKAVIDECSRDGVSISIVIIGSGNSASAYPQMQGYVARQAESVRGRLYVTVNSTELVTAMGDDLKLPEIKAYNPEPFHPYAANMSSPLFNGITIGTEENRTQLSMELGGFYGVRAKSQADVILTADYGVPIYAQWKYGKGTVGSFMCDLKGTWSSDFLTNDDGKQFLYNVIGNLMPTTDIEPNDITINFKEDNYLNRISVYANLQSGERILADITDLNGEAEKVISLNEVVKENFDLPVYTLLALSAENNYSRCNFAIKAPGVYKITLKKVASDGTVLCTYETYKTFSYSLEYNTFIVETDEELSEKVASLAVKGNGESIEDLENTDSIFNGFVTELSKSFDPRLVLMILSIILFLTDIAVRKFKFKWIHEIVREKKAHKDSK